MSKWELPGLIFALLCLLAMVVTIGSCTTSCIQAGMADSKEIASGSIEPIEDCFGDIVDYRIGSLLLVEEGVIYGGRTTNIFKEGGNTYFNIESAGSKKYILYLKEGKALFWTTKNYTIGCEE